MARQFDVDEFLEREIYSRVPESLDRMLPEFGWTRKRNHWEATNKITTRDQFSARADRVTVYDNRPHWVVVQGGQGRRLLDLAAGGVRPRGDDFWTAVRKLADAVGVAVPSRSETPRRRRDPPRAGVVGRPDGSLLSLGGRGAGGE